MNDAAKERHRMDAIELEVGGMTCDECVRHVREALQSVPGVASAEVSLEEKRAVVRARDGTGRDALVEAVEDAGYRAGVRPERATPRTPEVSTERADGDRGAEGGPQGRHLLVVGGGSAAFAAAIRGAELGARVTMVERGVMAGTCVNRGCVPSKTLIQAAEVRHRRRQHGFAGIPAGDGTVAMDALVSQKGELVERLRATKYRDVLAAYPGVEYLEGEARFAGADEIAVALASGGTRRFPVERIVLATGARPWLPELPGLDELDEETIWTNEQALEAEAVPGRLVVAGAGPVGVELAQLFARLGSRVTLLAPRLVPAADGELTDALADYLREEGLEVVTGARLTGVRAGPEGPHAVADTARGERGFPFDRLLLATGRTANTQTLAPERAGIATVGRGFLTVDDRLRTSRPGVYAAGDCTDRPQFVYVAARAGGLAAENALGGDRHLDLSAMPAVVFSDPQLAWVGLTEQEARARYGSVAVRSLPMEQVARALANRDTRGLIKLVARPGDGRLLGVHILAPQAGEVVQTGVLALQHGLSVDDLADTFFPYLTEVEGLKLAAQTFRKSVDKLSCCAG